MFADITDSFVSACSKTRRLVPDSCADFARESLGLVLSGKLDAYYASFAVMVLKSLGADFDAAAALSFLAGAPSAGADLPNAASFARAVRLCGGDASAYLGGLSEMRADTPYDIFLKLAALADCGLSDMRPVADLGRLESFRGADGGFSNIENSGFTAANATAAAIVARKIAGFADGVALSALMGLQDESGGFRAHAAASCPDLLSTASSLFAMRFCGASPIRSAEDFAMAHFLCDGSFSATVYDASGDCEYLFYGLLVLGLCQ